MSLFSFNSFVLGVILCVSISLCMLPYVLLARLWQVKIRKIGIFGAPVLLKRKKNDIEYILGWIPYTTYVQVSGMLQEDYEMLPEDERAFALYGKPWIKKALFFATPTVLWLLFLLLCFNIMGASGGGFSAAASETMQFSSMAVKTILGTISRDVFTNYATTALAGKNVVVFSFALISLLGFILAPLWLLMQFLTGSKNKITRFLSYAWTLITCVAGWKIISFTWSFFSFGSNIAHIASYLWGTYATGIVLYLLIIATASIKRPV